MPAGIPTKPYLNSEECWKDWIVKFGTVGRVRNEHIRLNRINPRTDRVATEQGIKFAAIRWALVNQAEARKDLAFLWSKSGHVLDDEHWKKWLVNSARLTYQRKPEQYKQFIIQNGLQQYVA